MLNTLETRSTLTTTLGALLALVLGVVLGWRLGPLDPQGSLIAGALGFHTTVLGCALVAWLNRQRGEDPARLTQLSLYVLFLITALLTVLAQQLGRG